MSAAEAALLERARRAYERGRAALGLETASLVAPMALVSWLVCRHPGVTLVASVALVALVGVAVWRGREQARAARLGLLAGAVPLILPLVAGLAGHVCGGSMCLFFPGACLAGGLIGGVALGFLASGARLRAQGLVTAGLVASLAGSLGCLVAGTVGVAALVAGLAFGLAPVLTLRRA
jgi:hypothetical protein